MYKRTDDANRFAQMLGCNIKYLRLRKKVFSPMKMISYHLGISHQQMAKYENGLNMPSAYRLTQIADYYKVSIDDIVNPNFIHYDTKNNEILDKAIKPTATMEAKDGSH